MLDYLRKTENGLVLVASESRSVWLDEPLSRVLERMATAGLCTVAGRITATGRLFHLSSKVPIYLSQTILLLPIRSLRSSTCLLINYYAVRMTKRSNNGITRVYFGDDAPIEVPTAIFARQFMICQRIDAYLVGLDETRKCFHP